jgi:hypothetical protein
MVHDERQRHVAKPATFLLPSRNKELMKYAVQRTFRNATIEDREAATGTDVPSLALDDEAMVPALGQISGETSPQESADGDVDRYHT